MRSEAAAMCNEGEATRAAATRIVRLGPDDRERAVEMLARAFADYPVMRYVLADRCNPTCLGALIGHFYDRRLLRGWPLLGAERDGALLAAALVSEPGPAPWPEPLLRALEELRATIGNAALARLERYEREADRSPAEPHHTLGVLGVDPECQGTGVGRGLLDAVASLAREHPDSTGVCLNTESRANVGFYERCGYRTLGDARVDGLRSWCLFRPAAS